MKIFFIRYLYCIVKELLFIYILIKYVYRILRVYFVLCGDRSFLNIESRWEFRRDVFRRGCREYEVLGFYGFRALGSTRYVKIGCSYCIFMLTVRFCSFRWKVWGLFRFSLFGLVLFLVRVSSNTIVFILLGGVE